MQVTGCRGDWLLRMAQALCLKSSERVGPFAAIIQAPFKGGQSAYGSSHVLLDLRETDESRRKHRVPRLIRENEMRAKPGSRARRYIASKPAELIPNLIKRNYDALKPNEAWMTDIT